LFEFKIHASAGNLFDEMLTPREEVEAGEDGEEAGANEEYEEEEAEGAEAEAKKKKKRKERWGLKAQSGRI
jgi:hypothetical protein